MHCDYPPEPVLRFDLVKDFALNTKYDSYDYQPKLLSIVQASSKKKFWFACQIIIQK